MVLDFYTPCTLQEILTISKLRRHSELHFEWFMIVVDKKLSEIWRFYFIKGKSCNKVEFALKRITVWIGFTIVTYVDEKLI